LSILTGDEGARQDGMTPAELDVLTQTLIANAEWPALWRLVFDVPLAWSVRAVRVLARDSDGWQPETPEEAALLQELAGLAQELPEDAGALAAQLPPALLQARARVPGRINDVAFSPLGPHLAIGTGVRKVVVWDYARAQRERVLSGLGHSIGCVAFGGDGVLLAAERTNRTEVPCGIFRWDAGEPDDQAVRLGGHTGSVTVLIPLGREQVLSAGRDGEVVVWHTHTGQEVARRPPFPYQWPRTGAVSPDGRHAVFMHTGLDIVALSEMGRARSGGMAFGTSRSVVRAAAFVPSTNSHGEPVEPHGEPVKSHGELVEPSGHGPSVDSGQGHVIIAGCYNGEVVVYRRQNPRWYSTEPAPLTRHPGRAEGVAFLAGRGVVVTAGSEGRVRFIDWESRELLGEVEVPLGKVTSLRISPDGLFMALGNSEAQLSLWDLRALDARLLLEDAFAQAAPADLTALEVVLAQATLDPPLQRALQFVDRVLRHRFRFDIQVSEAPVMMMGEFDIEVE
jgi:WD40 repeat protein